MPIFIRDEVVTQDSADAEDRAARTGQHKQMEPAIFEVRRLRTVLGGALDVGELELCLARLRIMCEVLP